MAKFRYSMQNVLDIKLKMETQARQNFSTKRYQADAENEKLNALYARKAYFEEEAQKLRIGKLEILELEANQQARFVLDHYIANQQEHVDCALRELEEARQKLMAVMIERKTHEILKQKAFDAFLIEENRAENIVIDETTSYTYVQKRQVNE